MNVSTKVRLRLAGVLLALGVAACSDSPMAPHATTIGSRRALKLVAPSLAAYYSNFSFTLDPQSSHVLSFGPHKVYFPAYSVCDPATSSYGEGTWDQPCEPLQTPLAITATFTLEDNHARIDFQPALRFVPAAANDTSSWVTLTLSEPYQLDGTEYSIDWLRPMTGEWVDESLEDPTMKAWTNPVTNSVTRRIKHFSGYNVTAGFVDDGVDIETSWW